MKLNKVYFLLIGCFVLIWAFISYDLKRSHTQALDYAHTQLGNLTHLYAEEVSSAIETVNYVLVDLRDEWKNNPEAFGALVESRLIHLNPSLFNVGVISPEGKLLFSSANWRAPLLDFADTEYFLFHSSRSEDQLHIDKPRLAQDSHRLAIIASRPLPAKEDKFKGVITVAVSPEYFSRFHEHINLGKDSAIALARMNGDLLARFPKPGLAVGTTVENAPWTEASPGESGFFRAFSALDKVERLYAWRVLEEGKLVVIMGQSMETLLTPHNRLRHTYLWGASLATLFLLLAAYAIGRHLLQRTRAQVDMERMEEALQRSQKLEAIGKLTGGVAHDFNNILQILSSNIQILGMTAPGSTQLEHHLNNMSAAIARGSKLTTQLLTFARRQPLHPMVVNLNLLITEIDSLVQPLVGPNITVRTSIAQDLWEVKVDPALLENVILNLAANARDAMDGKGTLSIGLTNEAIQAHHTATYPGITPGDYVMLSLTDSGSGMPPEVLARVFEPFFTTKPPGKGTGLGLAMAYGFVKESKGHIHIDSEVGKGTTIRIFLPRATIFPSASSLNSQRANQAA